MPGLEDQRITRQASPSEKEVSKSDNNNFHKKNTDD